MSMREDGNPKPVTVKIIKTVYVEADTADDFKSVVQRLTGKDAVAIAEPEESSRPAAPQAAQSRMGQGSLGDRKAAASASSKRQNGGYPPSGGYINFTNQPQFPVAHPPPPSGESFHLVGLTQAFNPFSPTPQPPYGKGTPPPAAPLAAEKVVNIDNDKDDVFETSRTTKRRHWTHDEEERLASAWLKTSKDPIYWNEKSRDTFWGQISNLFNKNIQEHLKRDINQLKIHWTRLRKNINEFNDYFISVTKINRSGYSDDMQIEEAQQMYKKKYGKLFTLEHWWKKLKNEPTWTASIAQSEKEKKKRLDVDATDDGAEVLPIGREAAKAQHKGKQKLDEVRVKDGISILGENINKIAEITQERKKDSENVTQAQLEISRNQLKIAMQQKEAKLLEAYTSLLVQDTSQMTQEAKATRDQALASFTQMLFGNAST